MTYGLLQQVTPISVTSSPATTDAFASTTTAGQMIVVVVSNNSGTTASTSVTDSKGNTYAKDVSGSSPLLEIWRSVITTGGTGHTVSVAFATATRCCVIAQVFSAPTTNSPFDTSATASGTGTTANSGNTSAPATTSSLVIAAAAGDSATATQINPGTPTNIGNTTAGSLTDSNDSNHLSAAKFTTPSGGAVINSVSANVGSSIGTTPNNQWQCSIYTDSSGVPGTLVATSSVGTLTASSWNTAALSVTLAGSTNYWIVYNSNGAASTVNNLKYNNTGSGYASNSGVTFGTWPSTFPAGSSANVAFSLYATYNPEGFGNALSIPAAGCSLAVASKTVTSQSAQSAVMTLVTSQGWRSSAAVYKEANATGGPSIAVRTGVFLII